MDLDRSIITQSIGMEGDIPYLREICMYFYCVSVASTVYAKGKNSIHCITLTFVRAWGSYHILLPILLGTMPSTIFKEFDLSFSLTFAAVVSAWFAQKYVPTDVNNYLNHVYDLATSIVKGNYAGFGYMQSAAVLDGSLFAPWIGAFAAVEGNQILEGGVKAFNDRTFDDDMLLAVSAGPLYFALTTYVDLSPLLARNALVFFRFSTQFVNYNNILAQIVGSIGGRGAKGASSRGRSSTPGRKKK